MASDRATPAHRFRGFAIRLSLGVAVIAILLWHFDARPVFAVLRREQLGYFAATVALYVAGQVMSAYRWQMVAAILKLHGSFVEFVTYYFVGMFTNLFVPGLVGGDAARAIYLGRAHGKMGEAVASAIADRGLGLLALFWLAALSALFLNDAPLPQSVIVPTVAVGGAALAGLLAAPFLARLIHLMPRPIRRAGGIVAPYLHHPASLLPAIALSFVLQVSLAVCQYLLARGLGLGAPLSLFLLCVPIANVFASVPLTLNGLGIRESAYLVLFGMAGMAKDDAIALGLLWFASTMLGGLTGAIAFAFAPARAVVSTSQATD
ncbi:MAG TPA: lysylphosphatidylglycerol synthase transmembrane domain-containing protein [Candidatus Acidoferrales bacterium]|nr:lysylphosphatidylglycerol synthase transmembrane domain-containing protein [Candidatus Acidoferrales bacterium]